ncbi:hypothetical protein HDU92_003294 [Lobulomyces angularis]|nr:hypothetical protein HDU92_003294 [Lobulomyces angularis]
MVNLVDKEKLLDSIKQVRDDHSNVNWVVLGHQDDSPENLHLVGLGSNGLEEMKNSFSDEKVQYGLLRVTTKVDLSETVKFVYIYNLGSNVKFMLKGRIGVVKGEIQKYFQPWHVAFEIETSSEISEQDIERKVKEAAGTFDNVKNTDYIIGRQERGYTTHSQNKEKEKNSKSTFETKTNTIPNSTVNKNPQVSKQATGVKFGDKVRDDKSDTIWMVGSYENDDIKNPIVLVGSGKGGYKEFSEFFKPESLSYVFLRVIDKVDGNATRKFVLVNWVGENVSMMKKAKVSTNKGEVNEKFSPFHVDFTISEKKEINDDIILAKVQAYSGSKSFVKEKSYF